MHASSRLLAALAVSSLFACSMPPPVLDAGDVSVPDTIVYPDVGDSSSRVADYRRCTSNADCDRTANDSGAPEICDLDVPGGMCRRTLCTNNGQCGPLGVCVNARGCLPRCERQSDTCSDFGGVCLAFALPFDANSACFPACDPAVASIAADAAVPSGGARACLGGLTCDPYRGNCTRTPSTTGALNGEPCLDDGDCRSGLCIPETDRRNGPRPTGFLGGYCVSHAPLPTEAVFMAARGMNLPRSVCPMGTVMLPSTDAPGSAARCMRECANDAACRPGYRCDRTGSGTAMYANGGCVPVDCAAMGASCPAGSSCVRADGDGGVLFTGSRCVSGAAMSADGGADATTSDAATSDVTTSDASASDAAMDASDAG